MSSRFGICFQAFVIALIRPYYWTAYRVRCFGRLPWRRTSTLVLCNHQNDLDTTLTVAQLQWSGPWRKPVYSAASRRMFEPGFIATRLPWASSLLRTVDSSKLFRALGLVPIENELRARSLARYALFVLSRHGEVALTDVFRADVLAQLGPQAASATVGQLLSAKWFARASDIRPPLKVLLDPYRSELVADMREHIEPDYQRFERLLEDGNTLFLTPEGHYSRDGRMLRLQAALMRLEPFAHDVYLLAVSYDVFVGQRLSVIFRIVAPPDPTDIETSMRATRPITVSQLFGAWLFENDRASFSPTEAIEFVQERVAALPPGAFIDPDLRSTPARMAKAALQGLLRLGMIEERNGHLRVTSQRKHPQFPHVDDIIGFQARFFGETVASLERLAGTRS